MFPTNSERLIGVSDACSAFVYGYPPSCPRAHCTPNKSVTTLRYTRRHGPVGHACRHLPSAVPWISEDRLLANICFVNTFRVFVELRRSYIRGPKSFVQHVLGIFAQFGEPCLRLLGAKSSPVDEEKTKLMTVSILHSLRRELTYLLTCGRRSFAPGIQNDVVVS